MSRLLLALALSLLTINVLALYFDSRGLACFDAALNRRVTSPGTVHYACEGGAFSHWGEHGVRAKNSWEPGSVLVVGDSMTAAMEVGDEETYSALLERRFGRPFLNLGRAGQNLADAVGRGRLFREFFQPSWTIVALSDEDLGPASFTTNPQVYRFEGSEARVLPARIVPRFGSGDRQMAAITRLIPLPAIAQNRVKAVLNRSEPPLFRAGDRAAQAAPEEVDLPVEAMMDRLVDAYDGRLTVLYLSLRYRPLGESLPNPLEERALAQLRKRGVGAVSTRSLFPRMDAEHRSIHGFSNLAFNEGHLNPWGHARVAELVASALEVDERGFVRGRKQD